MEENFIFCTAKSDHDFYCGHITRGEKKIMQKLFPLLTHFERKKTLNKGSTSTSLVGREWCNIAKFVASLCSLFALLKRGKETTLPREKMTAVFLKKRKIF